MSFKSMEDIIQFAADKEKEAEHFYEDASHQEIYSGSKQILKDFAEQEKNHYNMLMDFQKNDAKLDAYKFEWIPDLKRSDYLTDKVYKKGMPYKDLLILAMKREEKSLKLYNDLQKHAESDEYTKLFKMLTQEEARHKKTLETLYDDYMAQVKERKNLRSLL